MIDYFIPLQGRWLPRMSTSEDKDTMDSTKSEEETKDKKTKAKKNKKGELYWVVLISMA